MSSHPGYRLEDYLLDAFLWPTPEPEPRLFAEVVALYEPARESIERQLEAYDSESQSWRDYRNAMAVPMHIEDAADRLICVAAVEFRAKHGQSPDSRVPSPEGGSK